MKYKLIVILIGFALNQGWAMGGADTEALMLKRIPKQKIVLFASNLTQEQKHRLVKDAGGHPVRDIALINAVVAYFPQGITGALGANPDINKIVNDGIAYMHEGMPIVDWDGQTLIRQTPLPIKLDGSKNSKKDRSGGALDNQPIATVQRTLWNIERLGAPEIWAKTQGQGVKVCIVDSGVDTTHPDLAANIAGGKNFVTVDEKNNISEFKDEIGHGTHVSGIIAAVNDDNGIVGMAPKAQLYHAKVFGNSGSTGWSTVVAGIDWCVANKTQVINMSLGSSTDNEALHAAVKKAHEAGLVIVASAGNSYGRPIGFPGAYEEAIGVSSSDFFDKLSEFSSVGAAVDLIAPGSGNAQAPRGEGYGILSTYLNGGYTEMRGTSMSAPHVTGAVALLLGRNPGLDNKSVKTTLENTAKNLGLPAEHQGRGLVDIKAAVALATGI